MEELYAGSWNYTQGMPHREKLSDYLKDSIEKAVLKQPQEWILVSVGSADKVGADLTSFETAIKSGFGKDWE